MSLSGHYYCTSCNTDFDELEEGATRYEWNPDARRSLGFAVCPHCGDTEALEDAYRCADCQEWYAGTILDDDLCPGCQLYHDEQECEVCRAP